jgi:hypothetical protein
MDPIATKISFRQTYWVEVSKAAGNRSSEMGQPKTVVTQFEPLGCDRHQVIAGTARGS